MKTNIQNVCGNVSIVLPSSTRLSGAAACSGGIAAVDGHSPYIYLFDDNGCFKAAVNARRPYDSISTNDLECFVCCGCGCDKNIYFLNDRFEETGAMTPDRSSGRTVSASFYTEEPYDNCIAVTFDRSIKLFRPSGEYAETLREESDNTYYFCYQSFPGGDCAAFERNGVRQIALNENDNRYSVAIGNCDTPKSIILMPCGDLKCVIGYRYLYNDLIPLNTDGSFSVRCR